MDNTKNTENNTTKYFADTLKRGQKIGVITEHKRNGHISNVFESRVVKISKITRYILVESPSGEKNIRFSRDGFQLGDYSAWYKKYLILVDDEKFVKALEEKEQKKKATEKAKQISAEKEERWKVVSEKVAFEADRIAESCLLEVEELFSSWGQELDPKRRTEIKTEFKWMIHDELKKELY
ncbi:MAG TPA: hypothetical protein VIQ31_18380 [Phormidium sp.]